MAQRDGDGDQEGKEGKEGKEGTRDSRDSRDSRDTRDSRDSRDSGDSRDTAGRRPRRDDGYAPLGDYLGVGDGRSVALLAADGDVDWWALPDLDGVPAFAALLDAPGGGRVRLRPTEPYTVECGYLGDTNVVQSVFTTDRGSVRVTDAMNTGVAGRLPWSELARRVEGLTGEVPLEWQVAPGSALGTLAPWATSTDRGALLQLDDLTLGVCSSGAGTPRVGHREVSGAFTARAGTRALVAVVATAGEPLHLPLPEAVDLRIDRTVRGWQDWSDTFRWDGPYEQAVRRSALTLKLLLYAPTGAVAAAATASLPERIGGGKNWDYRYTWVRDTAYVLDAFLRAHLHEEVHAALAWLLATLSRHREALSPFYTLTGELPGGASERDVPGHRGSRAVVDGNDAVDQLQLGPYGDLFQTVLLAVRTSHELDRGTARLLSDLADRCCDTWQRPDAGMWELPGPQHHTVSKMSCWQALDRAARLAELGQLPGGGERWRREAEHVRAWVHEHCWSAQRRAYTMHPDTQDLDAGVLLGARFGFDRGERMAATVDAVAEELGTGPWRYRYSGMGQEEGAFLACTFWEVEALAFTGRTDRGHALMAAALKGLRHAPVLAEMVDPETGAMLGNLPQALSHLSLINAASALGGE